MFGSNASTYSSSLGVDDTMRDTRGSIYYSVFIRTLIAPSVRLICFPRKGSTHRPTCGTYFSGPVLYETREEGHTLSERWLWKHIVGIF